MVESIEQSENFLRQILDLAGLVFDLRVTHEQQNLYINITGKDAPLILGANGEALYALDHLLNKIFAHVLDGNSRIICDVNNFRTVRNVELRAMAQYAADQVRKTSQPFVFAPMNSNERRVVHEFLADDADVKTESADIANERRLRVIPQR